MYLSAAPITLNYGYDSNVSLKNGVVYALGNLAFSNDTVLASAKDITLNKDQLLVLTDNIKLNEHIEAVPVVTPEQYVYSTLITDNNGNYLYAINPSSTTGGGLGFTTQLLSATTFNLSFSASNTVQIFYTVDTTDLYLITNTTAALISGGLSSTTNSTYYTYYYNLSGDALSLLSLTPILYSKWVTANGTGLGFTGASATTYNNLTLTATAILHVTRLSNDNAYNQVQTTGQSDLVKYNKDYNSLDINSDTGKVPFNYLVSTAFKTVSANSLSANINTLKNYYSPLHDQSAILDEQLRAYNKIYTGLNETEGSDKIYLGYNAEVSKIIFEMDVDTYFHYPYGTDTIALSSSSLVSYGARADITPFRSDKLFKKNANYKNYSSWGNSSGEAYPHRGRTQRGTYFCSWLSAATTSTGDLDSSVAPVWVDRYFDPVQVNSIGISLSTITSLSGILVGSINNYPNLIWDVTTDLVFEPGVLYYYHRLGDTDNTTISESITGIAYQIKEWGPTLLNEVTGLTAGTITSFTTNNSGSDASLKASYYLVSGTYGVLNTNNSVFEQSYDEDYANDGNTFMCLAYKEDWSEIIGDQILGNYFNGGLGIFNDNPILTPIFTVGACPSVSGSTIRSFNTNLELLNYETFTTFASSGTLSAKALGTASAAIRGTYDGSYYIIDNYSSNRFVSTFDPDDLITKRGTLSADLPVNGNNIIESFLHRDVSTGVDYIITKTHQINTTVTYSKFTTNCVLVTAVINNSYNNFVLDLSGTPVYYNSNVPYVYPTFVGDYFSWAGTNGCVDSTNTVFTLSANGTTTSSYTSAVLVRGTTPILKIARPEYINCDQDDNIWITYNTSFVAKVNRNGKVIWNKQINTGEPVVFANSNRVINFLAECTENGIEYYGLIVDGKSQTIYKIDTNGNVIRKVTIDGLLPGGDCTGFDYQRKYIKPLSLVPSIKVKVVCKDDTGSGTPMYKTLSYPVSGLSNGWHHFAATIDEKSNAKLYVDGRLVDSDLWLDSNPLSAAVIRHSLYNYKNNPQICIGTSNFKNGTLNSWTGMPTSYLFNGKIADVRYYNVTLSNSDISTISKVFKYNQFTDLPWVIPTGTREYIEEIERFFLHRLPGSKSQFYNIKIKNSGITDTSVQAMVENNLQNASTSITPAYTKLRSITWE